MYQWNLTILSAALICGILACTPRVVPDRSRPGPEPQRPVDPTAIAPKRLTLSPGSYRYRLSQTAEITAQDSVNTSSRNTVTTTALFYIDVSQQSDSSYSATVSIDSLRITAQGSIPQVGEAQARHLDSVLQVALSPTLVTSREQLADSLCSYGHLISTARLILLPELGLAPEVPLQGIYTDTTRELSCRAGTHIESLTTRRIQKEGGERIGQRIGQLAFEQQTELYGTGLLRQDSVRVSGSVSGHGVVSFAPENRLPLSILMTSEGTITVQLGVTKTAFRQASSQEIRLEMP